MASSSPSSRSALVNVRLAIPEAVAALTTRPGIWTPPSTSPHRASRKRCCGAIRLRGRLGQEARALEPGGRLLIRDHVMDDDRTHPAEGALFAINMLLVTEGGGTYTLAELERGLREAGFRATRLLRRGERMDCLVEARK